MNLTFRGFLKNYCRELSGLDTLSLKKLCSAAANETPRVAEPLFLLALAEGKLPYLLSLASGTWMKHSYQDAANLVSNLNPTDCETLERVLPRRYGNVLRAYRAVRERVVGDRRISGLMRKKTLDALQASNVSIYRLCKDLGLNLGNVYAYLSKGDVTKVSRDTARTIMEHAVGLSA